MKGTSMATPHITAAAAMLKLMNSSYTPARIEQELKGCAVDLGDKGWDRYYGYGLPDLSKFAIVEPTTVTLDKTDVALDVGSTVVLTATVAPDNASNKSVTWRTSDSSVATVKDGVVTGIAEGGATITAETQNGKSASCRVTVTTSAVSSGTSGTCAWEISPDGRLTIRPIDGTSGVLGENEGSKIGDVPAWCASPDNRKLISSVRFEGSITALTCASMFVDCGSLSDVDFSGLSTSRVTSMASMFSGCTSLASVDLSSLDMTHVTDASSMFLGCKSIAFDRVKGLGTSSVENLEMMFSESGVTSVQPSSLDLTSAKNMRGLFYECGSLRTVDLSGVDAKNGESMSIMFEDCDALVSVNLSGMRLGAADLGGMFGRCVSLVSLDATGVDASKVTDMSQMFMKCTALKTLDLRGLGASGVQGVNSMFNGCASLESLDLSTLDVSNVTGRLGLSSMFSGCSSLKKLDLSQFDTAKVTTMKSMFQGCTSLSEIDLSSFDTSKVTNFNNLLDGCVSLSKVLVGGGITSGLLQQLPSYEVQGHTDWYSQSSASWYTSDQIASSRAGLVDTYTKSGGSSVVVPTGITLDRYAVTLTAGDSVSLTAAVVPANAADKSVTWSTSDSTVATVSGGAVTAIAAGKATVSARTSNGLVAECVVTVSSKAVKNPLGGDDSYWVVFTEGYRDGRVEAASFSVSSGTPRLVWNKGISVAGATLKGQVKQYLLNDSGEWEQIGTYGVPTDWALEVVASNVPIYDANGAQAKRPLLI